MRGDGAGRPVPSRGDDNPGGAVQVLFEAQLEGLAHGADDALGEALAALQDVAGWGAWHSISGPRPADALQPKGPSRPHRASPLWLMGSLAT